MARFLWSPVWLQVPCSLDDFGASGRLFRGRVEDFGGLWQFGLQCFKTSGGSRYLELPSMLSWGSFFCEMLPFVVPRLEGSSTARNHSGGRFRICCASLQSPALQTKAGGTARTFCAKPPQLDWAAVSHNQGRQRGRGLKCRSIETIVG